MLKSEIRTKIKNKHERIQTMSFLLDVHTHTIASGHAYNTMTEMIQAAKDKGLLLLGITEHAPAMPGSCQQIYFHNLRVIPREEMGIKLMLGAEANIMDYNGTLDLDSGSLKSVDHIIASLHSPCINSGTKEENTRACINAMKNPRVSILGHPDDGRYPLDYDEIVRAAKDDRCLLEVNNSSLNPEGFRKNSRDNIIKMLKLCEKYGVSIVADSDAHVKYDVGNFDFVHSLLNELKFPEELVVNHSIEKFMSFIK